MMEKTNKSDERREQLISRKAAIELLLKWADGYSYIETPTYDAVEAFRKLPSAEPEVTEEAVKDYCRKRCLTILTNDYFHKLTSAQPLDVQIAYYKGVNDGIEQCTDRLKRATDEALKCLNGRSYGGTRINDYCSWAERRQE